MGIEECNESCKHDVALQDHCHRMLYLGDGMMG